MNETMSARSRMDLEGGRGATCRGPAKTDPA